MSLVDYQSSSDEESDGDEAECESKEFKDEPEAANIKIKKTVKIGIPSLAEFEEDKDDGVSTAKKAKLQMSSGLLSMLPPPKFSSLGGKTTLLVPNVLKKKITDSQKCEPTIKGPVPTFVHPAKESVTPSKNEIVDSFGKDATEGSSASTDYFSLESKPDHSIADIASIPLPIYNNDSELLHASREKSVIAAPTSVSISDLHCGPQTLRAQGIKEPKSLPPVHFEASSQEYYEPVVEADCSTTSEEHLINDEGFLRLQGKKMRRMEDVNFIDISGDSLLADRTDWHVKSLTEEKKLTHSHKKGDMPTHVQKRKHQITYLAYQAKERELDLKNQWAQNKLTKQQTQSKYGF